MIEIYFEKNIISTLTYECISEINYTITKCFWELVTVDKLNVSPQ